MGLGRDMVDAIIREHSYRPISGDVLLIGGQVVDLSMGDLLEMVRAHGVPAKSIRLSAQHAPEGPNETDPISAGTLFRLLGAASVRTLVAGAGEKGDVVHALGTPLPGLLEACADFVVDCSALVNKFDAALTLENYADLLRPGGRLLATNTLSNHFDPYTTPSAVWFLDYFVTNGFADCRVYVLVYPPHRPPNAFCVDVDCLLDPAREVRNFVSPYEMATIVFAEKGRKSTSRQRPVYGRDRSPREWDQYRQNLGRMKRGRRPFLGRPRMEVVRSRDDMRYFDVSGGYLFVRTDYAAVDPSEEERRIRGQDGRAVPATATPVREPAADGKHADAAPKPALQAPAAHRLRTICVGTGRDGTQSLTHMIQYLFDGNGDRRVMHEYCCRELYQAFCDHRETGEASHAGEIERMIADCPYDCIVGNGYAAILPLFARHYGRSLKLVHLHRADRDACIASLKKNCELFPTAYGYYSSSPEATVKRMAAFHFGEMSREEWDVLSIDEKFGWYYDKTHALIRQHATLFDDPVEITTEGLDQESTRKAIADVAGHGASLPPKAHLNASVIDIASYPREHQHKMHWLMGRFNTEQVAHDEVYALDYFLEKYIAWTGYQINNSPELGPVQPASVDQIRADLDRAVDVVAGRLKEIESLQGSVRRQLPLQTTAELPRAHHQKHRRITTNGLEDYKDIFAAIEPWAGNVPRGFDVDFQGTLTDVTVRQFWQGDGSTAGGKFVTTSLPTLDNIASGNMASQDAPSTAVWEGERWFEAVNWYVAAREARSRFVMITLGAWHGSQAVGSYRALQSTNPMPCKLVAVEPMVESMDATRRHFRNNGIDPADHWLIPSAISGTNEAVFFPMGSRKMGAQNCFSTNEAVARENYYKLLVDSGRVEQSLHDLLLHNSTGITIAGKTDRTKMFDAEIRLVSAVTLADVLGPFDFVDYLESDIQESEILVFPPFMDLLKKKVRRIHIGTHGKAVHWALHDLFVRDSWDIVFNYEPDGIHKTILGTFKNDDGVLTARNPDL